MSAENQKEDHKIKWMVHSLSFLGRYYKDGDEFLSHILTGDKMWIVYYTLENKCPPYSLHLVPSDFHLFLKLKEFLGGKHLEKDDMLKEIVKNCFNGQVAEIFDSRIQKWVPWLEKCLNANGDCC